MTFGTRSNLPVQQQHSKNGHHPSPKNTTSYNFFLNSKEFKSLFTASEDAQMHTRSNGNTQLANHMCASNR